MRLIKFLVVSAVSILTVACASQYETVMRSTDPDVKYKAAFNYFNQGKYRRAAELFESLVLAMQGLPQEDTVKYYNALSNYEYGDYITAESNFSNFMEVFPRSPFAEQAAYLRIKCLYYGTYRYELDQTPTKRAMTIINEFMYENPDSKYIPECKGMIEEFQERLDRKSYEAAKLYYDMEDYKSASYALRNVLRENSENQYREQVLFYTAMASYKYAFNSVPEKQYERYLTFMDDYYNYIGEFPDTKARAELDHYYERVQSATQKQKGVGADSVQADQSVMTKEQIKAQKEENAQIAKELKKAEKLRKEADKLMKKRGATQNEPAEGVDVG